MHTRDAFFIGTEYEQKFNYLMVIWIIFWAKTTYDVGYKSFVDEKKQAAGKVEGGGGDEGDGHVGKISRKTREVASGGARTRSTRRSTRRT